MEEVFRGITDVGKNGEHFKCNGVHKASNFDAIGFFNGQELVSFNRPVNHMIFCSQNRFIHLIGVFRSTGTERYRGSFMEFQSLFRKPLSIFYILFRA
jgi:hypothetical protein